MSVEKSTEENSTFIPSDVAAADKANDDNVCLAYVTAKEPSTSTFFENINDKSSYDLGNFTIKILSNNEKHQILDMGPLEPSGPFPKDIQQNNRCFSKSYYFSTSKYGPVNRFWLCYSKILDAAYCQPCWLFTSQRIMYGVRAFGTGDICQKELNNIVSRVAIRKHALCMNFGKKVILSTRNLKTIKI